MLNSTSFVLTTALLTAIATPAFAKSKKMSHTKPVTQVFSVSSSAIKADSKIDSSFEFNCFGCTGKNESPDLTWKNAPKDTKSFAIMVHDPDAPTGGAGWWHWVVYNIPATVTALSANAGSVDGKNLPTGAVQQKTDFGSHAWGGVCPPKGHKKHHYHFTVYALNIEKLDIPADATASLAGYMINANSIATASFIATYQR